MNLKPVTETPIGGEKLLIVYENPKGGEKFVTAGVYDPSFRSPWRHLGGAISILGVVGWEYWANTGIEPLRKAEPKTYRPGQRFKIHNGLRSGDCYLLAQTGPSKVVLVSLVDGNRWSGEIEVETASAVSEDDMKRLVKKHQWTLVE